MATPDRKPQPRPAIRRDAEGNRQVAPTWESLIDRQIREAMEQGAFDDLPHQGSPLPAEDDAYAGEMAMAFHVLRNAGAAPPWIEADKEVRAQLARRDAILARAASASPFAARRDRRELADVVAAANAAIARLNAEAPTERQHRRPLDPVVELAALDVLHRR